MKKPERDSAVCPPIRLDRIVESLGGHLRGRGDIAIQRVASLQSAASGDISFLSDLRYRPLLEKTRASAVILPDIPTVETRASAIICENPYLYFAEVANLLHPIAKAVPGIHPSAIVDGDASVSTSAQVDAGAYIGRGAHIAAGVVIGPGCSIGAGVSIDVDTHVHPRVTVYADCQIGKRGIVHSGAVIGADGFGMALKGGQWLKIPQTGRVIIGDDVEIGANTTIDRGALDDTVIGDGVKLDNLIQVGHNVRIGAHTAIAGCVGIAGSAHIGKHCTIGGGAIILGHLELADGVHVSATTLITKSVKKPGTYTGAFPFDIHANWGRSAAAIRNLGELVGRVRKVESLLRSENTPSSGKDRRSLEAHLSRGRSRKTEVAKGSAIDGHH